MKAIIEQSRQQAGLIKAGISIKAFGPQARLCTSTVTITVGMTLFLGLALAWTLELRFHLLFLIATRRTWAVLSPAANPWVP